jgi:hypothetical protein
VPVWKGAENLAPPVFDPRTVQLVASRYTDWATGPPIRHLKLDTLVSACYKYFASISGHDQVLDIKHLDEEYYYAIVPYNGQK